MTRELFTSTIPTEPGMYYLQYPVCPLGEEVAILTRHGMWFGLGTAIPLDFDAPPYIGTLFGPRVPSPSELAGNTTNEEKPCES